MLHVGRCIRSDSGPCCMRDSRRPPLKGQCLRNFSSFPRDYGQTRKNEAGTPCVGIQRALRPTQARRRRRRVLRTIALADSPMASPRLATQIDGFEWRTLLGPTHHWPTPTTNFTDKDQQPISIERCELCGQPVGDGRPFITDSAGQTPVHIACSNSDESTATGRQPARIWWRLLQHFISR
jgi:hypothetical protein